MPHRHGRVAWVAAAVALVMLAFWWSASSESTQPPILSREPTEAGADSALAQSESERSLLDEAWSDERHAPSGVCETTPEAGKGPSDAEPCLLLGALRDERGFPVELDRVDVVVRAPHSGDIVPIEELGPGRFCVRGSRAGRWSVQTKARDYFDWRETVEVEPGGGPHEVDIVLEPCMGLDVFLDTASGESLLEPARRLLAETPFCSVRAGPTCSEATARNSVFHIDRELSGRPARLGFVRVAEPAGGSTCVQLQVGSKLVDTRTVGAGADSVTFTLADSSELFAPASVRCRLVGELSGKPPKWCAVKSRVAGISAVSKLNVRNAEGLAGLSDLAPGRITLTMRAPGYGRRKLELVLEPGEHRDLGDVTLPELAPIRVSVVTSDGIPAIGARVGIIAMPWTPEFTTSYHYRAEDDRGVPGQFTFYPETEQVVLRATHGESCSRSVRAEAGDEVMLVLEASSFEVPLSLRGVEGATWWLVDSTGLPVAHGWVPTSKSVSVSVLPGAYAVHVVTLEEDASSFPVTFEAP